MKLNIVRKNDYLLAEVSGQFNMDEIEGVILELVAACKQQPCQYVLVDAREVTGRITLMDRHRLGMLVVEHNQHRFSVAFVSAKRNMLSSRYLETVINNRWIPVLVTTEFSQAEDWLRRQTEPVKD